MSEVKRYEPSMEMHHESGGEFVAYEDYAALQQKLDAVLGDGITLRKFIRDSCYAYNGDGSDVSDSYTPAEESPLFPRTSDTDATLNEVRADGADVAAAKIRKAISAFRDVHSGAVNECADIAEMVAAQLRTGSTEGGV